ncbi:acyltransferase [Flavobacterium sp. CLA17]|uniref:acyltransferase family protein n=1 Tax=Flavobacterium sp. CLA17 TaxID=2724135 RepID=UPI0014917AC4|nr:acyltransferase [Flavobacterium sp. CLA17]QSB27990.1 acyltransferase [Flavobacterium sp. CLA17]
MRIEQLTFTRFLAAVSVVVFHYGGKSLPFKNDSIAFIFRNSDVCVSYFFILSGFVMIIAYGNKTIISAGDYLRNRMARIYPVYFLAILMMLLLQFREKNIDYSGLFLNIFMIQAWVPGKVLSLNPPGWSLSVELLFYAIFPFAFNTIFKKVTLRQIAVYIILFWVLTQVIFQLFFFLYDENQFPTIKDILKYNPLMHLNEFLVGNLAGLFFIKSLKEKKGNYDFIILILAALLILALKFPFGLNFHDGLLSVLFIPLIFFISLNDGMITQLFRNRIFVFLGEISFGIYILQHPVYSLISAYSVNKYLHLNDPTIVFFIRLLILIVFSAVVYICMEKPILEKVKGKKKPLTLSENPVG